MLNRHRQAGFTLVEMLMVVGLIALLAAVLAPSMIPTPNNQLRSNAADLMGALRATRLHAMQSRHDAALQVNTEERSYQRPDEENPKKLDGDFKIQLTTARNELTDAETGAIRFFPDGSSTGGRITLSNGNMTRHVDIGWLTGRIRLLEESSE